jgi:hypothetical protein
MTVEKIDPKEAFTKEATYYPMSSYEVTVGEFTAHWSVGLAKWKVIHDSRNPRIAGTEVASGTVAGDQYVDIPARQALHDALLNA